MIKKKIKDIGTVYSGATPKTNTDEYWNGNIAWVTPKEINQLDTKYLKSTERNITERGFKSCSATMLPKGSILFTSRAPIGLVAIADIDVCTNQGFKSIVLNNKYSSLYVYYYLKNQYRQLNNLGTGTTFKELSKSAFEKFEIPFPEKLVDQIRIGEVLSKTENLIKQRKESIDLLDKFLRSTFLDMFGDPLLNNKRWEKLTFDDFFKIEDGDRGKNYPSQNELVNEGVLFLNTSNFKKNELKFDKTNFITLDK
ncbi:restriction endonuclease subunit S, partial [Flavobacterium antarcticum]